MGKFLNVFFYIFQEISTQNLYRFSIEGFGEILGIRDEVYNDVVVFNKVPYALPPINDLRFAAPQPVTDWKIFRKNFKFLIIK